MINFRQSTIEAAKAAGFERPEPGGLQLFAAAVPGSVDLEARTVRVRFTTATPVKRFRWVGWEFEEYELVVDLSGAEIDYLNSGRAPYLDAHNARSNDAVLGVIEAGSVEINEAESYGDATVRFGRGARATERFEAMADGINVNVSMGFNILEQEETREADPKRGVTQQITARRWEIKEISQVPMGADPGASRVNQAQQYLAVLAEIEGKQTQSTNALEGDKMKDGKNNLSPEERERLIQEGAQREADRQAGIRLTARTLNLPMATGIVATLLSDSSKDLETCRAGLIDHAAALADSVETQSGRSHMEIGAEDTEKRGAAMSKAMLFRAFPHAKGDDGRPLYAPDPSSIETQYVHRTLVELAADSLEERGIKTRGLSRSRIAEMALNMPSQAAYLQSGGMLASGDYPLLLADVANKSLRRGYETANRTFTVWCRQALASDFKNINRLQHSGGLALEKVAEGDEYTHGRTFEAREQYKLATYGRIMSVTRQTIVNDDLDAFTRIASIYGQASADLESDTVYAILGNNPNMADGTALFDAAHNNIMSSSGAPTADRFGEGRKLMRLQTDLDGSRILNTMPRFVIFPAALETSMDKELSLVQPNQTSQAVPGFVRELVPVPEGRLDAYSATRWYMAADYNRIDTIEYAYLDGEQGVQLFTRNGFEVDGMEMKARLDFAAKAIDWRGMVRNDG